MRNELLGYLLGALDADERAQIELNLASDHELRGEMELLRRGLTPLEADDERFEPPAELWRRTVDFVMGHAGPHQQSSPADAAAVTRPNPVWLEGPRTKSKWRMVDVSVAAGILVAALSVVVPAVIQSRANAERRACAGRLADAHTGISQFAGLHNGILPMASLSDGIEGKAGIYAPILREAGYLQNDESVICPGSELAREQFKIPTMKQVSGASGPTQHRLVRVMGGSYAYRVGYWENGRYHPLKLRLLDESPLMADLPGDDGKPRGHHGGCGRNVLFAGGGVKYIVLPCRPGTQDKIYLNDDGERDAGLGQHDTVLLPSDGSVTTSPKMLPIRNAGHKPVDD